MRRALAGVLAALLLGPAAPAGAQADPAALRSELADLAARYRAVQAELRESLARINGFGVATPLAERQVEAARLLRLRETLASLGQALDDRRRQIASLPDWYVVTVEGAGVSTARSSLGGFLVPELQRLRGFEDVVVRVDPGRQATDLASEAHRALAPPGCRRRGSPIVPVVSAPEFWEDLRVSVAAGPFATRQEAEARRRPGSIGVAEVLPYPDPNALLRQFGCPEHPMARVRVAEVRQLPLAEAEARLKAQGLVPVGEGGDPAPSAALAYTVQASRPEAGAEVAPGARVALRVYAPPSPGIAAPDLRGVPYEEAVRRLAGLGLGAERADAGPAPARPMAGAVARQDPPPGAQLARGATVRLGVHGAPVPTPEEQVAAARCPPRSQPYWDIEAGAPRCQCEPGLVVRDGACVVDREGAVAALQCPLFAQPYWDEQAGRAQCRCMPGYAWSGPMCVVDRAAAVAAVRCPANAEGYWDDGARRAQCRCRAGLVWNGQACVVDRAAAVAAVRCPPNAEGYWDDGAGSARCRCRAGHTWNGQACVVVAQQPVSPARTGGSPPRTGGGAAPQGGPACPPGQVPMSDSVLGQGDVSCVTPRR